MFVDVLQLGYAFAPYIHMYAYTHDPLHVYTYVYTCDQGAMFVDVLQLGYTLSHSLWHLFGAAAGSTCSKCSTCSECAECAECAECLSKLMAAPPLGSCASSGPLGSAPLGSCASLRRARRL